MKLGKIRGCPRPACIVVCETHDDTTCLHFRGSFFTLPLQEEVEKRSKVAAEAVFQAERHV